MHCNTHTGIIVGKKKNLKIFEMIAEIVTILHFRQKGGFQPIFVKWQGKNNFVGKQEFLYVDAKVP